MEDKFKISTFKIDDPQELALMYDTFKEDTMYPGNWSTKVKHRGIEKWWKVSTMVYDNVKGLGLKAGDKFFATRREGKKGSYTEVSLPNDIQNAPQNRSKAPSARPMDRDAQLDGRIPMEAYTQSNDEVVQHVPYAETEKDVLVRERIIRGMAFNNACVLLSNRPSQASMKDVKDLTLKLHDTMQDWLREGENKSLPFSN